MHHFNTYYLGRIGYTGLKNTGCQKRFLCELANLGSTAEANRSDLRQMLVNYPLIIYNTLQTIIMFTLMLKHLIF